LLGGHTVRDAEIKFGYAVTGLVEEARMLTNAGARPGDSLLLTKPLGTGVLSTALKAGRAPADAVDEAARSMASLNARAATAAVAHGAHAATDITGFGLIGHALGMARESRVTLELRVADLPFFPAAVEFAEQFQPGGLRANRRQFEGAVAYDAPPDEPRRALLFDPQTSGGLLLALPASAASAVLAEVPGSRLVGAVVAKGATPLRVL
jgi:selenide,water dikinase